MPTDNKLVQDLSQIGSAVVSGGADLTALNEARNRGNSIATDNQVLADRSSLTPFDFLNKYGPETQQLLNSLDQGNVALGQYMKGAQRTPGQALTDSVIEAGTGFNRAVGGIGVLGAGILNPTLGNEANELLGGFVDYTRRNMSNYAKRNENIEAVRSELDARDNVQKYGQQEQTDGSFMAGLKYIGRDFLNSGSRVLDNPAAVKSTIAQGTGSLLAAGPVGKALQAGGVAAGAAMPAAIGVMEGGGAYSGSLEQIMGMSHEDLMTTSESYRERIAAGATPEEAKIQIAHNAGIVSAAIQGPVGAVIGKVTGVGGFEAAPLATRPIREVLTNLAKEPLEEGLQSFTGQVAQNLGTALEADPNQAIFEDAGGQAAIGAIGGIGAAGVTQAPGTALRAAAKAAGKALDYGYETVKARGEKVQAQLEADSQVSVENLGAVVEAAAAEAPVVAEAVRTLATENGAKPEEIDSYIARVQASAQLQEQDFANMPSETATRLTGLSEQLGGKMPDKLQTAVLVASMLEDQTIPEQDRADAAVFLLKQTDDLNKTFVENQPEFLDKVSHDRPEFQQFQDYAAGLTSIQQIPSVKKALDWARTQMQMPDRDLTAVDLNSDDGAKIVSSVMDTAVLAPMAMNPKVAEHILLQADEGTLQLAPERRRVIRGAVALQNASRLYAANMRLPEPGLMQDQVEELNEELDATKDRDNRMEFVTKQIETEGGEKAHQLSLTQHVAEFQAAISAGDRVGAKRKAQRMSQFARSHRNKVAALNTSIGFGDGRDVPYEALSASDTMYLNTKGVGVKVGSAGGERFARKVYAEALSIAQLANDFATQYPEFGISQVEVPTLNLNNDKIIIKDNQAQGEKKEGSDAAVRSEPSGATTLRTTENEQASEPSSPPSQPIRASEVKSSAVEEVAPVATDPVENIENDPLLEEFDRLARVTRAAEKESDPANWTPAEKSAYAKNDWETFSRLRGYTEKEINDFREWLVVADKVSTKYGEDFGVIRSYELMVEDEALESVEPVTAAVDEVAVEPVPDQTQAKEIDPTPEPLSSTVEDAAVIQQLDAVDEDGTVELTTAEAFPSLVQPKGRNWFHRAFRLPKMATARLMRLENPVTDLQDLLARPARLVSFTGRDVDYVRSTDDLENMRYLLSMGETALVHMKQRLKAVITEKKLNKKGEIQKSVLERLVENDEAPLRWRNLRALNILDKTETSFRYNPQLLQSAIVAGLDWVMNIQDRSVPVDVDDVARIMEVNEADAEGYVAEFNRGLSVDLAVRSLSDHIQKFWGVSSNREEREAYTKGIPEGVAKEVLYGLQAAGLLELGMLEAPELTQKTFGRVWFDTRSDDDQALMESLGGVHELLGDIALIDREIEGYAIGAPVTDVDGAQLRNPMLKTTRQQKQALENVQKAEYLPNLEVFDLVQAMGEEAFVSLMSGIPYKKGDLKKTHKQMGYNRVHWESVKGLQRGYSASFRNVAKQMSAVRKHAEKAGVDVSQMPTFYKHHINKLGRIQMAGLSNPQADKLAREIFMSTKAKLNLAGNRPDWDKFLLTIGQGVGDQLDGLKTEKESLATIVARVESGVFAEDGTLRPLVNQLKIWLKNRENGQGKSLPDDIMDLFGGAKLSMHGMHSLVAVARYELARDRGSDLSAFESMNYLEADGKTNGPINSLMLMASGRFDAEWLRLIGKGGAFFGRLGKSLDQHEDKEDLYQEAANKAQLNMTTLAQELAEESPETLDQFHAFKRVLAELNTDVRLDADGNLTIKRGLTKNPLTITIYGSGADGIAGKITSELVSVIYEQMSQGVTAGVETVSFTADFNQMLGFHPRANKDTKKRFLARSDASAPTGSPQEFKLNKAQYESLQANVKMFLVDPIRDAITEMVDAHVSPATSALQEASQLQSIFEKALFVTDVTIKVAELQANAEDSDYNRGDFLSRSEMDIIRKNNEGFSSIIDTGTQRYSMSNGETSELFEKTRITVADGQTIDVSMPEGLSRSLTDDMRTPVYVQAPTLAGVRAIPTMVVGSGDGQMILNGMSNQKLASRTLPTFDGLQMPADAMGEFSRDINEAVFKTWTTDANPLRAAAKSFANFIGHRPVEALFEGGVVNKIQEQALLEISQAFHNTLKVPSKDILSPADAQVHLEEVLEKLEALADDIDARRQVISEMPFSVDQMASAKSPFVNQGSIALPDNADPKQIVDAMNARYDELRAEASQAKNDQTAVEKTDPKLVAMIENLAFEDDTGARVFHGTGLTSFFRSLSDILNPTQKEMARAAIKNLAGSDYRIVFGSHEQLDAWEQVYNADDFQPNSSDIYGKIDTKNKIILISNMSQETIVHELIHASTIEKLNAAYAPKSNLSKEDREAVVRLEALMDEWLKDDYSPSVLYNSSRRLAENAIRGWLRAGNKAAAVNEFMAWVLSNQYLHERAAKMTVKNTLARIIGDALAALKDLIWGAPNKGPRVGDSLLSNVRFNTRILMASPTLTQNLKQDWRAVVLHQSRTFGSSGRLTQLREAFNNKVVTWMNDGGGLVGAHQGISRANDVFKAHQDASQIAAAFAWQFPDLGNMQAYSTFTAIQTALMTEAELNTTSLSRVEELYAHVIKKLDVASFRENEDPNDQNDILQAQDKLQVLQGVFGTKTDKYGRSSLMSSFLALAMTSDKFRKILSKMDKPIIEKIAGNSLDAMLENFGNSSLDRLTTLLAGERKSERNVQEALDVLTKAMIDNVGDQRSHIEQHVEGGLSRIDTWTAEKIQEMSHKGVDKARDVIANSSSKIVRAGARVVLATSVIVNENDAQAAQLGLVSTLNRRGGMNTIKSLVADVVGRTKENAPVYDMISKVRALVQQTRQQFRDDLPEKLLKQFTKTVSKAEKTAMFKALANTDLAALTGAFGVDGTLELITSQTRLANEIQALETSLQAAQARRFPRIQAKSKQLAHFMMTGEAGIRLLSNAEAVSRLLGEQGFAGPAPAQNIVTDIDRLISLYALQELDQESRDSVASLIQDQNEGVKFITSYLMGQRIDELAKVNRTMEARLNHYKGHIPSEVQQGGQLIIASDTEHATLLARGYTRVSEYKGSSADRILGSRSYYFAPVSGTAPFSQGVLQTVHQTASGVDPETGYTVGEVMAGRITDANTIRLIDRQLSNQRANTTEQLRPIYDERGNLAAFERMADPAKLVNLHKSTDLPAMIGVWRGRQMEELMAQSVNEELVDKLHAKWLEDERAGRANEYVNIALLGANDDRILKEAAQLIPKGSRDYIKSKFGRDVFMVRRDMLLDTFGARQASVGDLFTGKTRWNENATKEIEKIAMGIVGVNAYKWAVATEKNVQEFVTNAKHLIVVKSVIVPVANIVANIFQLLNRGVPLRAVRDGAGRKVAELNFYIKSRDKELNLEADLRAAKGRNDLVGIRKMEAEMQSIKDSQKRLSIWPLIEAGEFSAISNGEVTAEDLALADGKWTNFVERKINELPNGLRTVARYALVTRDTALYQGLARSVQYGDFVAKAILYDDLRSRKKLNQKDAIAVVNEAFVNYNRLAGRGRQYLESMGLMWFYSYKIRSMKEAAYLLRNNPLKSLLTTLMPALPVIGSIGTPVTDNFLAVAADGRLEWSLGPSMGLNSFSLNPWVNLAR